MTTRQSIPSSALPYASAPAWFPAETVMTPRCALLGRERRELGEDAARLEAPRLLEELRLQERAAAERPARGSSDESSGVRCRRPSIDGRGRSYIRLYSGPSPPSGGVSRPPLAVIAPHWTQFDAVTSTSTTLPAGLASPATS